MTSTESANEPESPNAAPRASSKLRTWALTGARRLGGVLSASANGLLVTGLLVATPFALLTPLGNYSLSQLQPPAERTLVLHGIDGTPFARRGGCVAESVRVSEVPDHFVAALLAMEDRRFRYHLGVDPIGTARALFRNLDAGTFVQGGSTLTQQLVKNAFLSSDRTLERKQKEALLSVWLEWRLSKTEILEHYMSRVYFGEGCFGLRAAARRYFDKPVRDLTLADSAYLVALIKAPSELARDEEAAHRRADLVIRAMVETGDLEPEEAAAVPRAQPRPEAKELGGYYADWVAGTIEVNEKGDYTPLPVHTTFDPKLQGLAESALDSLLAKRGRKQKASEGAMVVMRKDGTVLAMVGGADYAKSPFNRAVQAQRQPGSAFKLIVYLAALRAGVHPDSRISDQPITIGDYEPKNFGRGYRGDVAVRSAFAASINTVAVRLSEAVGRESVIATARDLGISTPLQPSPSIALGSFEVNLLELTAAYAAVAAGAYPVKPWAITAFDQVPRSVRPPAGSGAWLLTEADDARSLLSDVVRSGTGRRARLKVATYGKTGTSQDHRDAWFIGFAGDLVVGVWVGNDDFSPMRHVTGGSLPAEIWHGFMVEALESEKDRPEPSLQIAAFTPKPRKSTGQYQIAADVLTGGPSDAYAEGGAQFGPGPFGQRFLNRGADRAKVRRGTRKGGGLFGRLFN